MQERVRAEQELQERAQLEKITLQDEGKMRQAWLASQQAKALDTPTSGTKPAPPPLAQPPEELLPPPIASARSLSEPSRTIATLRSDESCGTALQLRHRLLLAHLLVSDPAQRARQRWTPGLTRVDTAQVLGTGRQRWPSAARGHIAGALGQRPEHAVPLVLALRRGDGRGCCRPAAECGAQAAAAVARARVGPTRARPQLLFESEFNREFQREIQRAAS